MKVIRHDQYLLPNHCRNLVMDQAREEFVCFIENDNLVDAQWLSRFVSAIDKHEADVIIPRSWKAVPGRKGSFRREPRQRSCCEDRPVARCGKCFRGLGEKENDVGSNSRPQEFMETHCLFFRRSILERIGPFDQVLRTSEEIDAEPRAIPGRRTMHV